MNRKTWLIPTLLASSLVLTACDDDDDEDPADPLAKTICGTDSDKTKNNEVPLTSGDSIEVPSTYNFNNKDGECSVSYTGQTARNVMIADMKKLIASDKVAGSSDAYQVLADAYDINEIDNPKLDDEEHGQMNKSLLSDLSIGKLS